MINLEKIFFRFDELFFFLFFFFKQSVVAFVEFGVIFDSIFFFVFFNLIIFIEKRVLSIIIIVENKVSNEKYTMNAKDTLGKKSDRFSYFCTRHSTIVLIIT